LLTLNSCPLFTYQDTDAPRTPEPLRVYLPTLPESMCDEIDDSQATPDIEHVHPTLRKLHAAGFKGTFLKAYMLLTEITTKIGWDQLLKIRSQVFVMEEEYRNEKQTLSQSMHSRNPSTTALRGSPERTTSQPNGHKDQEEEEEDTEEEDTEDETPKENGDAKPEDDQPKEEVPSTLKGPEASHEQNAEDPGAASQLQNKRLCERWLDNLFMVLYEDLRVYTIWKTEMAQFRQQQLQYKKSAEEWEILGELAGRLHHVDDAVEAYQACLSIRFSPKALKGVLNMFERTGDSRRVVGATIRLICWQYRWYSEVNRH
jgi:hypothetical protein